MRGLGNDERYWKALGEGELRLPRCSGCSKWCWPAPYRCAECGGWEFDWLKVEMAGEVYSWTRVHHPFGGTDLGVPYVTVSVALPQADGIRLFGILEDGADARIGLKVSGEVRSTQAFDRDVPAIRWRASV